MDYLLNLNLIMRKTWKFQVLNLIINGLPSKRGDNEDVEAAKSVLNLIINGLPSKQ